jgi:hypothetical protein
MDTMTRLKPTMICKLMVVVFMMHVEAGMRSAAGHWSPIASQPVICAPHALAYRADCQRPVLHFTIHDEQFPKLLRACLLESAHSWSVTTVELGTVLLLMVHRGSVLQKATACASR